MTTRTVDGNDALLRTLIEQAPDLVARLAPDGSFLYASPAYERVLGYQPAALVGSSSFAFLHPEDESDVRRRLHFALDTEETFALTYRVRHASGGYLWLEALHHVVREPETRSVRELQLVARDVSARRREHDEQSRLLALAQDLFCIVDAGGVVRWVSQAFERQLGWSAAEIGVQPLHSFSPPDEHERIIEELACLNGDGQPLTLEQRFRRKDGSYRWLAWQMTYDRERGVTYCAARDLTHEREFEQRLVHQAYHDSLTGLPNRTLFLTRLYDALLRTEEHGGSLAVVLLDVDGFKLVNDSLGHTSGDALLAAIARRLATELRPDDVLARFGGDEFMLLLARDEGQQDAPALVARVQAALAAPFS